MEEGLDLCLLPSVPPQRDILRNLGIQSREAGGFPGPPQLRQSSLVMSAWRQIAWERPCNIAGAGDQHLGM